MEHCFEKKPNWEHKASFPGTALIQSLGINYSVLSWGNIFVATTAICNVALKSNNSFVF